jgi:hypothetical protein
MFRPWFTLAALLSAAVLLWLTGSALAATSVTCTSGPSDQAALQGAIDGGSTVFVRGHCLGNWTAANDATLIGIAGAALDGAGAGTVLVVTNIATVTINSLTIENGSATFGGGIFADSGTTVNINNSTIRSNVASDSGGGIYEQAAAFVNLTDSSVRHNEASTGGGIAVVDAFLTATNSNVSSNTAFQGGGIAAEFSDVQLTKTHVNGNAAEGFAGGIASFDSGGVAQEPTAPKGQPAKSGPFASSWYPSPARHTGVLAQPRSISIPAGLTLMNSTVDGNTAYGQGGGGIVNVAASADSLVTLTSTSVSYNNVPSVTAIGAGGIANVGGSPSATATLTVSHSVLAGNVARYGDGGAIYNVSQGGTSLLSLGSTSIFSPVGSSSPNQAALGGGIFNDGTSGQASASLMHGATVVRNHASITGGGIYNLCNGVITLAPGSVVLLNAPDDIVNAPC